ncbi:hypothetical protein SCLCIDRAFT_1216871 [Scleroderma citrinum Foug A]|uniref:Uncharacterized protein n=1 Tax=Scleroderma citrinum Foug A TaxID=1036808 RepID=A0A0C3DIA4_9AGAM|nr:hypothetical protein SCLCIDRAFT_1216871 [Scleroderma citrinum Foug A]
MIVGQVLVAMLMIIRVYAIYSQSRPILILLIALTLIGIVIAAGSGLVGLQILAQTASPSAHTVYM